jgi:predicted TIM-barrel fold metal-dependent hydrolase
VTAPGVGGSTQRIVVSADEHVVESRSFWEQWLPDSLPAADRRRAPRLEGVALALGGPSGHHAIKTFLLFPALVQHSDEAAGASDPLGRLAVLDGEGIDASVVFPQRAMAMWGIEDRDLMFRCFDAYNEWLADWCRQGRGRLHGVAILPTVYRPEATADYLAHLQDLGFRTMMLPNFPRDADYAGPEMSPLWSAIESSGLPLNFHISEAPDNNGAGGLGTYLSVSFQPFRKLWSYLVFSGILQRHAGLRVVFAEGGISWIPSALDHADRIHAKFAGHLHPQLSRPPSHYWFTQCYATFMEDPCGVEQIDRIGADRVLWSSDYPHPEGTFGATRRVVDALRRSLADRCDDALGATAARLYGL